MQRAFTCNPLQERLKDFTLSNITRFYLSMGDPLGLKGLKSTVQNIGIDE